MKKEFRKRFVALTLFALIVSIYLISFIFAQAQGDPAVPTAEQVKTAAAKVNPGAKGFASMVKRMVDGFGEIGKPIFGTLFGTYENGGDLTLQFLSFLLVIFVIYGILSTTNIFGNSFWIKAGIGAVVAIIGIRFIPPGFLEQSALSSSAFVVVLVAGLPFVLMFFLVKDWESPAARKAAWIFYSVVMFLIWVYYTSDQADNTASWIYPITIVLCIALFAFDGTLHRWFNQANAARTVEYAGNVARDKIVADIGSLQEALRIAPTKKDAIRIRNEIERKKDALSTL